MKKIVRYTDPFDKFFMDLLPSAKDRFFQTGFAKRPLMDVSDEGKIIKVCAELPGVDKDTINIDVQENSLSISAKTEFVKEKEKENYYYKERSYKSFERTLALPTEVLPEKTNATYKNGILEIALEKAKANKIKGFKVKIK